LINEKGQLDFEVRCEGIIFESGFTMYLNEAISIAIVYDGTEASFYLNGGLANRENIQFSFRCRGELDIGLYSVT